MKTQYLKLSLFLFGIISHLNLSGQTFAEPIVSPFGLPDSITGIFWQSLADIDGDGDVDYFHYDQFTGDGGMTFFENIGSHFAPQFDDSLAVFNPFGILETGTPGSQFFADTDNDGDKDFWWSAQFNPDFGETGGFFYYENLGTPEAPMFDTAVYNPYGLTASGKRDFGTFVDIDNDNDFDLFSSTEDNEVLFFENIGTPEMPNFAAPLSNADNGIPNFQSIDGSNRVYLAFEDLDLDNDYDLLACTNHFFVGQVDTFTRIFYLENIGTPEVYEFAAPVESPFNLNVSDFLVAIPQLADMDSDGDIDLFLSAGEVDFQNESIYYYENLMIISDTEEAALEVKVDLSPNPVRDLLNLSINSDTKVDNLTYAVYDVLGKSYQSGKFKKSERFFQKQLTVSDLSSGFYFLKIQSGNSFKVVKFEKI